MSSKFSKILVIILALGAGAFGVYYFYFSNPDATIPLEGLALPSDSEPVGEDILILADKIRTINIDPAVFSSPLFANLKDFSAPVTAEAKSRPNPFAPIGSDNSSAVIQSVIRTPQGGLETAGI